MAAPVAQSNQRCVAQRGRCGAAAAGRSAALHYHRLTAATIPDWVASCVTRSTPQALLAQHEADCQALQAGAKQQVADLKAAHRAQLKAAALAAKAELAAAQVRVCTSHYAEWLVVFNACLLTLLARTVAAWKHARTSTGA